MRFRESDLLQDLLVFDAVEVGNDVVVSVYGSRSNVCGTVRFTFEVLRERARSLRILRAWADRETAVSLLSSGDSMTLFCERTVLGRALAGATPS